MEDVFHLIISILPEQVTFQKKRLCWQLPATSSLWKSRAAAQPSRSQVRVCSQAPLSSAGFTNAFRAVLPKDAAFVVSAAVVGYLEETFIPKASRWCSVLPQHLAFSRLPGRRLLPRAAGSSRAPSERPGEPARSAWVYPLRADSGESEFLSCSLPHNCSSLFSIWIKLNWLHLANVTFSKDNFYFNYCRHRKGSSLRSLSSESSI